MAGGGGGNELNLIPYMDIVSTLVLAMFAITNLVTPVGAQHVAVPALGPPGAPPAAVLDVDIEADGFTVHDGDAGVALPRTGDAYPYDDLAAVLRGHRPPGTDAPRLVLSAGPRVPYKFLVATLDAIRKDDQGPLFPDVALGVAAR